MAKKARTAEQPEQDAASIRSPESRGVVRTDASLCCTDHTDIKLEQLNLEFSKARFISEDARHTGYLGFLPPTILFLCPVFIRDCSTVALGTFSFTATYDVSTKRDGSVFRLLRVGNYSEGGAGSGKGVEKERRLSLLPPSVGTERCTLMCFSFLDGDTIRPQIASEAESILRPIMQSCAYSQRIRQPSIPAAPARN